MVKITDKPPQVEDIDIELIDAHRGNVREKFDPDRLNALKASIEKHGLLQPIVVYMGRDGRYKLIIGRRRLEALRLINKKGKIRAQIIKKPPEETIWTWSLTENMHRSDLKRSEIIKAVKYLHKKHGRNVRKVADELNLSRTTIYDYLDIIKEAPPEALELYKKGIISREDLRRAIRAGAGDPRKINALAKRMGKLTTEEKLRLVEEGEENPQAKITDLLKKAKKARLEYRMSVWLPEKIYKALGKASEEIGLLKSEVGKDAIKDWLNREGYL